jgi:hypothetical protein
LLLLLCDIEGQENQQTTGMGLFMQGMLPALLALALQPAASEMQTWRLSWAALRNLCCVPAHATPVLLKTGSFLSDACMLMQQLLQRKNSSRLAHVLTALTNLAANENGQRQLLQLGMLAS